METTQDLFKLDPDYIQLDKMWVRKGELNILNTMSFKITEEMNKHVNKILADYLKRARLALRVLGGDVNWPLFTATSANSWKSNHKGFRTPGSHSYEIIKDVSGNKELRNKCLVKDIIFEGKIDIDSLSCVFRNVAWGNQEWKNLSKRFKDYYKPKIILMLMAKNV